MEKIYRIKITEDCVPANDDPIVLDWLISVDESVTEEKLNEMQEFLKCNREAVRNCALSTRISLFCALHSNLVTIAGCYRINQIYRKIRGLDQMA